MEILVPFNPLAIMLLDRIWRGGFLPLPLPFLLTDTSRVISVQLETPPTAADRNPQTVLSTQLFTLLAGAGVFGTTLDDCIPGKGRRGIPKKGN